MHNQIELFNKKRNHILNLLVKPTNDCNFDCEYCFDREVRHRLKGCRLSKKTLIKIMDMSNLHAENVGWYWHGGEVTLMGIDFYKDLNDEFAKRYATEYLQTFQSNGYLIYKNPEWIKMFKETGIQLGLSYDLMGQELRTDYKADLILNCVDVGLSNGPITVINALNIEHLVDMYETAKHTYGQRGGVCFNLIYETRTPTKYSLTIESYLKNIEKFMKYWMYDVSEDALHERNIAQVFQSLCGFTKDCTCQYTDCRNEWLCIESDGSLYPCDREMPEYYLGNISEFNTFEEVFKSKAYLKFIEDINKRYEVYCNQCHYTNLLGCKCNSIHTCSNATGRASEINNEICQKRIGAYNIAYKLIQNVERNKPYNKYFTKILKDYPLILPLEIQKYLAHKGYSINMTVDDKVIEAKKLHATKSYELFRVFNPKRDTVIQYNHNILDVSYLLNEIFNSQRQLIETIIERSN